MKYVCLIYFDEQRFGAGPGQAQGAAASAGEADRTPPAVLAAAALEPTAAAVTLRRRRGAVAVADGPFAATTEQLGGYWLIDAPNLDDAIKLAARVPSARFGSIEVRPVRRER